MKSRNYKKILKIMTHINSMKKNAMLGVISQEPLFVTINMESQNEMRKVHLEVWADYCK